MSEREGRREWEQMSEELRTQRERAGEESRDR